MKITHLKQLLYGMTGAIFSLWQMAESPMLSHVLGGMFVFSFLVSIDIVWTQRGE